MSKGGSALDTLAETLREKSQHSHDLCLKELELKECKLALEEKKFQQMMSLMNSRTQANLQVATPSADPNVLVLDLNSAFEDSEN